MPTLQPLSALISILLVCPFAAISADKLPVGDLHDIVAFKNGDTLTGNIPGTTSTSIDFSNPAVGHLTLKWADITSVQIKHAVRIVSGLRGRRQTSLTIQPFRCDRKVPRISCSLRSGKLPSPTRLDCRTSNPLPT
jgi:hypothetical protein